MLTNISLPNAVSTPRQRGQKLLELRQKSPGQSPLPSEPNPVFQAFKGLAMKFDPKKKLRNKLQVLFSSKQFKVEHKKVYSNRCEFLSYEKLKLDQDLSNKNDESKDRMSTFDLINQRLKMSRTTRNDYIRESKRELKKKYLPIIHNKEMQKYMLSSKTKKRRLNLKNTFGQNTITSNLEKTIDEHEEMTPLPTKYLEAIWSTPADLENIHRDFQTTEGMGFAKLSKKVFFFGGLEISDKDNKVYQFDCLRMEFKEVQCDFIPTRRCFHSLTATSSSKLVVFGGEILLSQTSISRVLTNDTSEFDLKTKRWSHIVDPDVNFVEPRKFHGVCAIGDHKMVIYGGVGYDYKPLSSICTYDSNFRAWSRTLVTNLDKSPISNHTLTYVSKDRCWVISR